MAIREENLIERIRRRIPSAGDAVLRLGIGDDCAVLRPARGSEWAISCDQFLEDVHFLKAAHPPEVVGYKALARATSDLTAAGAMPRFFLLSLALPASATGVWLDRMLAGMARAARRFGLTIAGGDTSRSPGNATSRDKRNGHIGMSTTVLGELKIGNAVSRAGARVGDAIFIAGELGAAQLGLELILRGMHNQRRWRRLLHAQYYPEPLIKIGQWLAQRRIASAMIDLSDGLSTDLARLCRASRVGARIEQQALPAVIVPKELQGMGIDASALALHGGEDYALLFSVRRSRVSRIPPRLSGTRIARIGEIVRGSGVKLLSPSGRSSPRTSPLEPRGWDHFARTSAR